MSRAALAEPQDRSARVGIVENGIRAGEEIALRRIKRESRLIALQMHVGRRRDAAEEIGVAGRATCQRQLNRSSRRMAARSRASS